MATVTITAVDAQGTAASDALVRAYADTADGLVLAASGRTETDGSVELTLADGDYKVHVDPISYEYLPQWYGGGDERTAPTITVAGDGDVMFILQIPVDRSEAEARSLPLYWKDTTESEVLLLYPGEEKKAFSDQFSDIYQHVLVGPFLTRAKAAAA